MSRRIDKAMEYRKQFREDGRPLYNCAQTTVLAFADDLDVEEKVLKQMTSHFGGGMKMGSVCGALTGGLMVLGLFGLDDAQAYADFMNAVKKEHEGLINCRDLLKRNAEAGGDKMTHCNQMIALAVGTIEKIRDARK